MTARNGLGTAWCGELLGPGRGDSVAPRPWWMGRVYVQPPTLVMMRGMASVTGAHF